MIQANFLVSKKCLYGINNCINSFIYIINWNSLFHIIHKIKLSKLNELLMTIPLNLYKSIKDLYVKDMNKINKITLVWKSHCSWDFLIQDMDKKGFVNIIHYQESRFRQNMKNKLCFCLQPYFF